MKFKTPFKVLTTAALIGTLSLSAVAPGAASAAEKTTQVSQKEAQENFSLDKVVLTKGDSKITISFTEYALYAGSDKLNGYELAFVTAKNGDIFSKTDYALYFKAGDTPAQVIERLSEADKAKTVEGIEEGTFDTEDGSLAPVTGEQAVEAAKADLAKAVAAAKATEIKDAAAKAELTKAIEAAEKAAAKEDATKEELEAAKAELTKAVAAAKKADEEAALEAKVESVTAINAKQIEVKFSKAVTKSTVVDADGKLVTDVFSKNGTAVTGKASLSEDGKTLTITGSSWEGTYLFELAKDKVKSQDEYVAAFAEKVSFEDKVAPKLVETKKETATKYKVQFSEPVQSLGSYKFELADGTEVAASANGVQVIFTEGNDYAEFVIGSDVEAGKEVKATFAGLTDYAGNLIDPNPTTTTFTKGDKDGVAPEVSEIKAVNAKKFTIKFSEEVLGLEITDIKVNGVALTNASTLVQDKEDKTKYTVTLNAAKSDLQTISLDANSYADLSGENGKAVSKIVNFGTDEVKPTLASSSVTKNKDGKEVLTLTFSEDVALKATEDITLSAKEVKDYVTTTKSLTVNPDNVKPVEGDATKFEILLSDISGLSADAEYTVTLPVDFVEDTAGNANVEKADAIKFTRGTDKDSSKPEINKTIDSTDNFTENQVAGNGIKVTSNNTFEVKFNGNVDNATVVNKDNYKVSGATVKNVSLAANGTVTVTLEADSNTYTGLRDVTISGIKTKEGVAMDSYTTKEYFQENVRPTVSKAEVSAVVDATPKKDAVAASVNIPAAYTSKISGTASDTTTTEEKTYVVIDSGKIKEKNADDTIAQTLTAGTDDNINKYSGTLTQGNVEFTLTNLEVADEFTLKTTAKKDEVAATAGETTVTLTFSEAIKNGAENDFDLYIKGEKAAATVATGAVDGNKLTLTIAKGLTVEDFTNGVQLKAATTNDITDKVDNKLNLTDAIDLKLN